MAVAFCNDNKNHNGAQSTVINDTVILDTSKLSTDTNNLQVNKIDTIKYSNLPYWGETMDRFYSAYIDTFSVAGNQFRFINPVASKPQLDILVYLERQINNKWVFTGFTVGKINHGGAYYHNRDVNGDGFIDITQNESFVQAVYFYDQKVKLYTGTTYPDDLETNFINPKWALLDTATKLFCDFQDLKQMCGEIHSTLYTFKEFKKYNLYDLELYNCTETDNNTDTITKLILHKCVNGQLDSVVTVNETVLTDPIVVAYDFAYFDYKKYWKDKYKTLLNYR